MNPQDVQRAVDSALDVVEAVNEPWLTRHVAQSLARSSTTTIVTTCDGDALLYDRAAPKRWVQSSLGVEPPR